MSGYRDTRRPVVDAARLWTGGLAAALVTGGVAMVAFIVVRGLLKIPVLGVKVTGGVVLPSMWGYAGWSAVAALVFTGLLHVLLATVPRPRLFFGWIGAIATAVAVLVPLTVEAPTAVRLATALVNFVIGATMVSVLSAVGAASLRYPGPYA